MKFSRTLPGPVPVCLSTGDAAIAALLEERFGPCLRDPEDGDALLVLSTVPLPDVDFDDALRGALDGDRLAFTMRGAVGTFDLAKRRGWVRVDTRFRRFDIFVENVLRMCAVELGARAGWRLMHAATVVDANDEALLLLGDSGAGKTTLTHSAARAGYTPINDDLVFVHERTGAAFSALFHRNAPVWNPAAVAHHVKAFMCVRQAEVERVTRLDAVCATREVLAALVTWRPRSRAEQEHVMDASLGWVNRIPAYALECTRGDHVWGPVARELY